MPNDPCGRFERAEQLNRKIDRLVSGEPSPLLDADTEELAEIARLLNERLPKDLPDPGFRAQLKQDLINPQPRLVKFPPRRRSRRYPVPVVASALALVMVATATVGWMVFSSTGTTVEDVASADPPSTTLTAAGSSAGIALATHTAAERLRASAEVSVRPTTTPEDSGSLDVAEPTPSSAPLSTATPVVAASPRITPTPTGQPTRELTDAKLPPVDREHIELGALATAEPQTSSAFENVSFEIDGMLPRLDSQAPAYHFATPYVDPRVILRGIAEFLGIDEEPRIDDIGGRQVYTLSSESSDVSFTWHPSSGAFNCFLQEGTVPAGTEDLSQAAVDWLRDFGFPVNLERVKPVIQTMDDGTRIVHVPLGELPEPAVGHPLSVSLVMDEHGRITQVSGYWLQITRTVNVPLVSAEDVWRGLVAGHGYWPDRPAEDQPGRFVVDEFSVSYVLTLDDEQSRLVLQPVIKVNGVFHPATGEPRQTAIYLQAAQATFAS